MWRTEASPLLEGHHLHGFLKRSHVCCLGWFAGTSGDGGDAAGGAGGGLARADSEVPSGGSLQTPKCCCDHWSFIGAEAGRSPYVSPTNKSTRLILVGSVRMQMCVCACVCISVCVLSLLKPGSHILVTSRSIFPFACEIGAAVTYTFTQLSAKTEKGV